MNVTRFLPGALLFAVGVLAGFAIAPGRDGDGDRPPAAAAGASMRSTAVAAAGARDGAPAPYAGTAAAAADALHRALAAGSEFEASVAAITVARSDDPHAIRQLLHEAAREPPSAARSEALRILLGRLADLAPRQALDALALFGASERVLRTSSVFERWGRHAPAAAAAAAAALVDRQRRRAAIIGLLEALRDRPQAEREAVLARLGPEPLVRELLATDIARQAREAPAAAFHRAAALTDPARRTQALLQVMHAWADADPAAAWQALRSLPPGDERDTIAGGLLSRWLADDPEAALAAVEESGQRVDGRIMAALAGQLAQRDPPRALAMMERLPAAQRQAMYPRMFDVWAQHDLQAALAWLKSAPPAVAGAPAMHHSVIRAVARQRPDEALRWVLDADERGLLKGTGAAPGLAADTLASAAGLLLADDPSAWRDLVRQVFREVARREPREAVRAAVRLEDTAARSIAWQLALDGWIEQDRGAALNYIDSLTDRYYATAMNIVARRLAHDDIDAAVALVDGARGEGRRSLIRHVAEAYAASDPAAAVDWVTRHRQEPGYDQVVAELAPRLVRADPDGAVALAQGIGESAERQQALLGIIGTLAPSDPPRAAGMLTSLSVHTAEAAGPIAGRIVRQWAARDPVQAGAWARALPPGTARDAALGALIGAQAVPPAEITATLVSIRPGRQRTLAARSYLRSIMRRDPDAAAAFLARAAEALPAGDVDELNALLDAQRLGQETTWR